MDNQLCGSDICISSAVCICDPNNNNNQGTFFHDNFFMPNYFSQPPKSMEEMKQALVETHMELEATRKRADQELRNRDHQLTHLKFLLSQAKQQTDQSQINFKTLISQLTALQNELHQLQQIHNPGMGFEYQTSSPLPLPISSDSDESIVSSPVIPPPNQDPTTRLLLDKPLPEKGKLLMAVMKAGPLLQTLLLAGPLPQWRHPPPPLDSYQIPPPPVLIPSSSKTPPPSPPPQQDQHLVGYNNSDHDCVRMMRKREVCGGGPDFTLQVQINKRPRVVV